MFDSARQEQIEIQNEPVLRLVKNEDEGPKKDYFLYYNSGVFPILLVVILFLCIGVIINIGLRIQNMNYDKKIYSIGQLISSEKERADRLNLKISELRSPSRIAGTLYSEDNGESTDDINGNALDTEENKNETTAEGSGTGGEKSGDSGTNVKKLDIVYSKTANSALISEIKTDEGDKQSSSEAGFVSVVKNIKDVLMVVSEGILTFFIP